MRHSSAVRGGSRKVSRRCGLSRPPCPWRERVSMISALNPRTSQASSWRAPGPALCQPRANCDPSRLVTEAKTCVSNLGRAAALAPPQAPIGSGPRRQTPRRERVPATLSPATPSMVISSWIGSASEGTTTRRTRRWTRASSIWTAATKRRWPRISTTLEPASHGRHALGEKGYQ